MDENKNGTNIEGKNPRSQIAQVDLSKLSENDIRTLREIGALSQEKSLVMPDALSKEYEENSRRVHRQNHRDDREHHREGRGIIAFLRMLAFVLVLGGFCAGGYMVYKQWTTKQITIIQKTLSEQILKVAELSTTKIYYTRLVHIEDSRKVMNPSYNIEYDGVIRLGLEDLNSIQVLFEEEEKVKIVLPHTEVLENGLIDQRKVSNTEYIFSHVRTEDIMKAVVDDMKTYQEQVLSGGVLTQADEQLQSIVKTILEGFGYTDVTYIWESK